jgi:hypothetical protein
VESSTNTIQNTLRVQFDANQNPTSGSGYTVLRVNATHASTAGTGSKLLQTWEFGNVTQSVMNISGSLGLGLTTPSASLHISGASTANLLRIESPSAANALFVSGSGRVGIGTTTPRELLHVAGGNIALDSTRHIDFGSGNSRINDLGFVSGQGYPITISTFGPIGTGTANNLTEKLRLTGSGSLGLGTTSPSARFHISGGFTDGNLMRVQSPTGAEYFFISASGNVGIGTSTPTSTLDVTGSVRVKGAGATDSTNAFVVQNSAGNNALSIANGLTTIVHQDLQLGNTVLYWGGSSQIRNISNGVLRITNSSNSDFTRLQFGGGTTAFPSLQRSGSALCVVDSTGTFLSNLLVGTTTDSARLTVRGSGATSATDSFLVQNATPVNLLEIQDNGQFVFSGPLLSLASSQSAFVISQSISQSATVGGQVYGVNITPTFFATTASQTETAFRVNATFTGSAAAVSGSTYIIADFGAVSAGSQLTVTDVTSGSIYMVNDVSGLPIIEATSDWTVNMYNYPNLVFQKTGSNVNITGSLRVTGSLVMAPTSSFVFPLTSSVAPPTGSAYWSGSFLFVYNGTRYMSASFV